MDILNYIQNKQIIICENNYKEYILKKLSENKTFLDVLFFTKHEFFSRYLFRFDERSIHYLVEKYNYKVNIAKMYLNNLYYIDESIEYNNYKLKHLVKLKEELTNENKLFYDHLFKEFVSNYQILVLGYPYLEKYEEKIFNNLNANILDESQKNNSLEALEFKTMEEEINYVAKKIATMINEGIELNKIKITNISSDYYLELQRIFKLYNIPIKIHDESSLYSLKTTQTFLETLKKDNLELAILAIKKSDAEIVKKIINITNKYAFVSNKNTLYKLLVEEFKNTKIDNFKFQKYVEVVDLFSPFTNEFVFVMNFNVGSIPSIFKDESFITDDVKNEVQAYLTNELFKINKTSTIKKIKSIKNIFITYKLKGKIESYPSSLINEMNILVKKGVVDKLNSYSRKNDLLTYTKLLDNYYKYGLVSDDLNLYYQTFYDIPYLTYQNQYTLINDKSLKEYLHKGLTLSYSAINNYNLCAFRYYISNILKIDKYEESFETFIGSLFHQVLEKCLNKESDIDAEINNYITSIDRELSSKEKFFISMLKKDLEFVIKTIKEQHKVIGLDKVLYEQVIKKEIEADIPVVFMGIIDKVLYKVDEDKTNVAIIDYKTGNIDIELKYLPYGLSLQLPVYLYLIKHSNLFENIKFSGFYLQHILDNDITRSEESLENVKLNNLKLRGYSNEEIHTLVEFDESYENSVLIKGMKLKQNGEFSHHAKVLSDNQIEKIITITEQNIAEVTKKILQADFNINPKKIGYDNPVGCKYCNFRDLCFKKTDDYVMLEEIENLDFLNTDE